MRNEGMEGLNKREYGARAGNFTGARVAAAALTVLLLAGAIAYSYTSAMKRVTLLVDGERLEIKTFAGNVKELLSEQNVNLGPLDKVSPVPETGLEDGMTVKVLRAIPVTLQVGNDRFLVNTASETVKDVLKERKIALGKLDEVSPGLGTKLEPGMEIKVDRVEISTVEEEVPIQFSTKRENDGTLQKGITRVEQRGVNGLARKTWEVTYRNGKETERRLVRSEVIKKPVDQVVRVGTVQVASRGGNEIRFKRAYEMVATAYTHTGYNTSTGIKPRVGVAAVDPSVIPLGTRMYVDGYGYCRALDVGGRIKGNRIDLFFETRSEALKWGKRKVKVYILE